MPIDIRVDSAERVRYSVVTGVVTDAEVLDAYERVVEDPTFDPTLDVIADMRGASVSRSRRPASVSWPSVVHATSVS